MKILMLGLTITSAWGNGHATTFRSLCRALDQRGHAISFLEKDVEWYRCHRDLPSPEYCEVQLYRDWPLILDWLDERIRNAEAILLGSYFPDGIAAADLLAKHAQCPVFFYDIDTPITVAGLRSSASVAYLEARQIPSFSAYMSFTGGPMLQELETKFGARHAIPLYCSVDPDQHYLRAREEQFKSDLSYLGTYAADRQAKLNCYLNEPARLLPGRKFQVAGPQYPSTIEWPRNVSRIDHLAPPEHAAFYSSSRMTLNLTRRDMVEAGFSPSVRLFEAAACGSAILSDTWPGIETFFTPGTEILLPSGTEQVISLIENLSDAEICAIGKAAQTRVLQFHTASHRASEFERAVDLCS